jgi:hypothetical protein
MTGTLGIVMWLMMGVMLTGLAGGGIAWLQRRLKRPHTRIRRDRS